METNELMLLTMLPEHVRFLVRDEKGDLWAVKEEPVIKEDDQGKFLGFGGDYMGNEADIDDVYSFAMFNHFYKDLPNLGVIKLRD